MNKRITAAICILLGLTAVLVFKGRSLQSPSRYRIQNAPAVIIGSENPAARDQYNYRRLRNPQTGKIPANIKAEEHRFAKMLPKHLSGSLAKPGLAGLDWENAGPFNVGGRTRALAMDFRNENIVLAGGVSGALYRSTTGGTTWTNVTPPGALHNATCLIQDKRMGHADTWYYGTGEFQGNSASEQGSAWFTGNGVFKSTDNGLTWTKLDATATDEPHKSWLNDYIYNIALKGDEVYYAMAGAIRRSTNGGLSWNWALPSNLGSPYNLYTDVAATSGGVLYATLSNSTGTRANSGIFRSTDGVTWTEITPAGWPDTFQRTVIGIAPSDENKVFFLCNAPGYGQNDVVFWRYDYLSGDGSGAGGMWVELTANLPAFGGLVGDYDTQRSYNMHVTVKPDNPDVVFIGGRNLFRSTDGFTSSQNTTWIGGYSTVNDYSNFTNQHADQHALIFSPNNPSHMLAGHDGGISKTTNNLAASVVWQTLNRGYYTTQFYTVAIDPTTTNSRRIWGGLQDNGIYSVNNASPSALWNQEISADGSYCAFGAGGSTCYASIWEGKIYRHSLAGDGSVNSWTRVDPAGATVNQSVNPFVLDPNNNNRLYFVGRDRIWRSLNLASLPLWHNEAAASQWEVIPSISSAVDTTITGLAISASPANRLYYGTDDGKIFRVDNAHTGSPAVINVWSGKGLPVGAYVSCLNVHPNDYNKAVAVFSNYEVRSVFYTSDGGSSWSDISGNLEENLDGSGAGPSCRWAVFQRWQGQDWLFLGTSTGLYSTGQINGSSTQWMQEGPETIGKVVVEMVVARPNEGWIVAATHGKGIFEGSMNSTGIENTETRPEDFALLNNYPNPFNPSTTIPFKTEKFRQIKLQVFDVRGRLVKTLLDGPCESGSHEVTFNGEGLASGHYFVRLESQGVIKTQKISLLK